jgi:hypothetical protein
MKLSFHKNSLRLRLTQSEVARLATHGSIDDLIEFPADQTLSFSVESGESNAAIFEKNDIRIIAPRAEVQRWIESDQEGLEFQSGPLKVMIEKDFQCLHKSTPEDADAFPNPMVDKF